MGCDVLRLAEQRADCAENRGKKHQAPCQGLKGINPSNLAGDHPGQEAVLRSNNALLISLSRVHNERKVSSKKIKYSKGQSLGAFQYLRASCLQFVMRVHFSVLK